MTHLAQAIDRQDGTVSAWTSVISSGSEQGSATKCQAQGLIYFGWRHEQIFIRTSHRQIERLGKKQTTIAATGAHENIVGDITRNRLLLQIDLSLGPLINTQPHRFGALLPIGADASCSNRCLFATSCCWRAKLQPHLLPGQDRCVPRHCVYAPRPTTPLRSIISSKAIVKHDQHSSGADHECLEHWRGLHVVRLTGTHWSITQCAVTSDIRSSSLLRPAPWADVAPLSDWAKVLFEPHSEPGRWLLASVLLLAVILLTETAFQCIGLAIDRLIEKTGQIRSQTADDHDVTCTADGAGRIPLEADLYFSRSCRCCRYRHSGLHDLRRDPAACASRDGQTNHANRSGQDLDRPLPTELAGKP